MLKTDNVGSLLSDLVLLLEKQVEGYSREKLLEFVEFLDSTSDRNIPTLKLGEDMKTVNFHIDGKEDKKITNENIRIFIDFMEYLQKGIVS